MGKRNGGGNPYHDPKTGRFTTGDFYTGYGYVDGKTGIEKVSDTEVWEDRDEKEKERQIEEQRKEAKRKTIQNKINDYKRSLSNLRLDECTRKDYEKLLKKALADLKKI